MSIKDLAKTAKIFVSNNSPTILTVSSVIGVFSTVVLASQDTIKAQEILGKVKPQTRKEAFDAAWKCYIPTAVSAGLTVACIVGSHYCSQRQKEALTSAYLLSQTTLHEYQKKVIERIGEKKEAEVMEETRKSMAHNTLEVCGYTPTDAIDTGHGKTLFYCVPEKTYFRSDINYVKTQFNNLNYEVRSEMMFDRNEINYRLGLPMDKFGSEYIFDVDRPLRPSIIPEIMDNGEIRVILDYELYPKSTYRGNHG